MATLQISQPEPYNPANMFSRWVDNLEQFILAAIGENVSTARKKAILIQTIGPDANKVIDNLDPAQKDTYEHLKQSLLDFYASDTSDVIERHVFNTIVQHQNEGIDAFVTRNKRAPCLAI